MGKLDGKVALISGGARGQGAAEAETFVREGAKVVFGDVRDADGQKVEATIRAHGHRAVATPGARLRRQQGRHPDLHEGDGEPARQGQDPLQLRASGAGRHRDAPQRDAGPGGPATTARARAAGADGNRGRDRDRGALSGIGRLGVHDRQRARHRRWGARAVNVVANSLTALVALSHIAFLILEMFFWDHPVGRRIFGMTPEVSASSAALAANQGLYNGFLAAGLLWALWADRQELKTFFLGCVVVAGVFGGLTAKRSILFTQALPALVALVLVLLASRRDTR